VSLLDLLALAGPLECCDSLLQVNSRDNNLPNSIMVLAANDLAEPTNQWNGDVPVQKQNRSPE
jgi:hypothetical protein